MFMEKNTINKNDLIDITNIFKNYVKHWYLFLLSLILCIGMAFVYLKIKNPVYQVNANILIKSEDTKAGGLQSAMMKSFSLGGLMGGSSDVYDELEIVNSYSILRQTVKELDLNKTYIIKDFLKQKECYLNSPLIISTVESIPDTLSAGLVFKVKVSKENKIKVSAHKGFKKLAMQEGSAFPIEISTPYGNYTISQTSFFKKGESLSMTLIFLGYNLAAEKLQKKVLIELVSKKANVINLGIEETNKQRGKDILNTIILLYNKSGIQEKNITAENTAKFLDERINIVSKDLATVEYELELYKKTNSLTNIGEEAKIMLEKNGDFKEKLITAETQYSVITLIEDFLASPSNKYTLVPLNLGVTEKAIAEELQNYNMLLLERLKLLRSTNEQNPAIVEINERVEAVRENVVSTIQNIKSGIEITIRDLEKQEHTFISRIKNIPTQEREFIDIQRQQMIKQELFVFLLQRKEENAINLAATKPKAQVIDAAYNLNKPLEPKTLIVLLAAFVLSFIIPIAYLYIKSLLNIKFSDRKELEKLTSIPILGEVGINESCDNLVVQNGKTSSIVELFRLIRTNLQFILKSREDKVILVTSSVAGEGKTFISSNLAMSLALLNKKVVLIGLDIRNPQLDNIFISKAKKVGLTEYLASENYAIEDIIAHSEINSSLDLIYSGPIPPNPSELLLSDRLDDLFNSLRNEYDYIILDSAPIGLVSDSFSLNRIADATIYICRADYTDKNKIQYVNDLVVSNRLKNVSLIINGTKVQQGYGYGVK